MNARFRPPRTSEIAAHAYDETADLAADERDSVLADGADRLPAVAADHRAQLRCRLWHRPAHAIGLSVRVRLRAAGGGPALGQPGQTAGPAGQPRRVYDRRSEERRVGKECRSRWS